MQSSHKFIVIKLFVFFNRISNYILVSALDSKVSILWALGIMCLIDDLVQIKTINLILYTNSRPNIYTMVLII